MKRLLLVLICFTFFFSCQKSNPELGVAETYFPSAQKLNDGVVNKSYLHFKSKDNYEASTDVIYTEYRILQPGELLVNYYDAGCQLTRSKTFEFVDNKMILKSEFQVIMGDSIDLEILQPVVVDWTRPGSVHEKKFGYRMWKRHWKNEVIDIRDTAIDNRSGKVLIREYDNYIYQLPADTNRYQFTSTEIFLEDIGAFSYHYTDSTGTSQTELIEQMSLPDFKKLAAHGRKRIAYIDPAQRLDKDSDFEPCGNENKIVDYYNGRPPAEFVGGKSALWKAILPQINRKKLNEESGYLTFRFIINCKGKIGYFTTEQAGLDFKKKSFNPKTVEHLYGIATTLSPWRATTIRKEIRDSYAYLTFKLKDGKVIELLP